MHRALLLAGLCSVAHAAGAAGCAREGAAPAPPPPAPAAPATASAPSGPEHLTFAAAGWSGARGACTEGTAAGGCDSEWKHGASAQLARVFVVPVADPAALPRFVDKLANDVIARGGIAEPISASGMTLVRFLERSSQAVDGGVLELATLNYALIGRDQRAVHLVTSVVPFDDQQPADERLRALLMSAAWQ